MEQWDQPRSKRGVPSVCLKRCFPKDPFVSPKVSGFPRTQSYDLGMGLEPSILFDPGGVWILRVLFSVENHLFLKGVRKLIARLWWWFLF